MKCTFVFPLTVLALALALTTASWAQETRPDDHSVGPEVKVNVWTCTDHKRFRLREKGACPLCEKPLVRQRVAITGAGAAGDPYPLDTCPVSGEVLGGMGPPIVMMHEGREVRLCCKGCIRKFEADSEKYLQKIDEAIVKDQLPHYPLTTCPVSQEELGSMGEPVNLVYGNRLVRFCCKGCVRKFKKAPTDYLAKLDAAVIANQTDGYPLSACPISGEPLDAMGGPVDLVFANRLVRFCCNGCVGTFYKAPSVHLAALDKARHEGGRAEGHGHDDDHGQDHGRDDDHGHDHDHDH
ncbi:MAG: hypothetical protein ACYSTY_07130 [Planctomycetota bacterium]|jgi:YHS domain-containing protein